MVQMFEPPQPDWVASELLTGTTIMAVEYEGGVVMCADSRTTSGAYIANRVTDKLTPITDNIYCCRSGSAADTQAVADIVRYYLDVHVMESDSLPLVHTAATLFRKLCYDNREQLMAGIICAGYDEKEGGQVFSIPIGGMCVRQPFSIGGSGSSFIYGYCDANYKAGMTREECEEFCSTAVALAMARDGSSGGCIRIAAINKDGVHRRVLLGDQLPTFFEG